jgi:ABC-type sugar transport system permease subunit
MAATVRPSVSGLNSRARSIADLPFILPAVGLMGFFVFVPVLVVLFRSVFEWNPGFASPFVGLENYADLARSEIFRQIVVNEFFYLLGLPLWTLLPLTIALVLFERVPASGLFRTIIFVPAVLSPAILGILFRAVLAPDGPVNAAFRALGLGWLSQDWLNDPNLVKPVIIAVMAWASLGTGVVIFSAALAAVPLDLFEAATLDGATWMQRLRFVVLPSLKPVIEIWVVLQVVTVFTSMFGWIFVLTAGGPGFASSTFDYDIYRNAIVNGRFGIAAAESAYLLVVVALLIGLFIVVFRIRLPFLRSIVTSLSEAWWQIARSLRRWIGDLGASARAASDPTGDQPALEHVPLRGGDRGHRWRGSQWSVPRTALMVLALIPFLYPLIFLALVALKTTREFARDPIGPSTELTLEHLRTAWADAGLGQSLINSVVAVGTGTILCLAASVLAAFWFMRHWTRTARALLGAMIGFWVLPYIVYIIPLFVLLARLGLIDSLLLLGVLYGASNIPFGIYLVHAYFRSGIPPDVVEAASVDGATTMQLLTRILVPLSLPILSTLAALTFVWSWGDLIAALVILQSPDKWTMPVAAANLVTRFETNTQESAAAALLSILPLLTVFLLAQKAIVRGITAGVGR